MSGISRVGDSISPETCYSAYHLISGSANVFVNGLGVSRVNDSSSIHCCVDCHDAVVIQGSTSVFVNGLPTARIGDSMSDTGIIIQGSSDVFAG
jgi:uncharacterized Zn-binding protein involved in type VI secretion